MKLSGKERMTGRDIVLGDDDSEVGTLSRGCCGTDFYPKDTRTVFVILGVKKDDNRIFDCIREIRQLDLHNLSGVFNYKHPDSRERSFEQVKAWFDEKARSEQEANKGSQP